MSDGPSGARGEIFGSNVPAAFIPSGVSLGATFDTELVGRIGKFLATEAGSNYPRFRRILIIGPDIFGPCAG